MLLRRFSRLGVAVLSIDYLWASQQNRATQKEPPNESLAVSCQAPSALDISCGCLSWAPARHSAICVHPCSVLHLCRGGGGTLYTYRFTRKSESSFSRIDSLLPPWVIGLNWLVRRWFCFVFETASHFVGHYRLRLPLPSEC